MVLMIDNYDSFTYNIVQYLKELGKEVVTHRNDGLSLEDIHVMRPDAIVISPGPKTPNDAGISMAAIKHFKGRIPILGICLGHQCIGQEFGCNIVHANKVVHGKISKVEHQGVGMFKDLPNPLKVTRYHSLIIDKSSLPSSLEVTATTCDGEIMAIRHREHQIEGVQFHPESILTEQGHKLLENFFNENN